MSVYKNEVAPSHTGPLEEAKVDSACCVCFLPMFFNKQRGFPDYWCQRCYYQFKDQLAEEWMKYLVRVEHARRMRIGRRKRRGETYNIVSYDTFKDQMLVKDNPKDEYEDYIDAGLTYSDTDPDSDSDEIDPDD